MDETIYINLKNTNSLKIAEKRKEELENRGYNLIYQDIGFVSALLVYRKEKDYDKRN